MYLGCAFIGLNNGTGFLAWASTSHTGTGGFYGSYVGTTGRGTSSFGIYSGDVNIDASFNAIRPFNGALTARQTFSVNLGNTTVGLIGLSLAGRR